MILFAVCYTTQKNNLQTCNIFEAMNCFYVSEYFCVVVVESAGMGGNPDILPWFGTPKLLHQSA